VSSLALWSEYSVPWRYRRASLLSVSRSMVHIAVGGDVEFIERNVPDWQFWRCNRKCISGNPRFVESSPGAASSRFLS